MTTAQLRRYLGHVDLLASMGRGRLLSFPAARITELKARGLIARDGDGAWYLSAKGKAVLTFPLGEPEKAQKHETTEKAGRNH